MQVNTAILHALAPICAGKKDYHATLQDIAVYAVGDVVAYVATDSFKLVTTGALDIIAENNLVFRISVEQVKSLPKAATLSYDNGVLSGAGLAITLQSHDGNYPRVEKVLTLPPETKDGASTFIAFDAKRFSEIARAIETIEKSVYNQACPTTISLLHTDPLKPLYITTPHTTSMLMPLKR